MLALDFINIGNGDCILIREMEGTQQKFALMVDLAMTVWCGTIIRESWTPGLSGSMREIFFGSWA